MILLQKKLGHLEWFPWVPLPRGHLYLEGGQEIHENLSIFLIPILTPYTQAYAYTIEEKANVTALNLVSQFQRYNMVDYDIEREVNETVRRILREDIPPF